MVPRRIQKQGCPLQHAKQQKLYDTFAYTCHEKGNLLHQDYLLFVGVSYKLFEAIQSS